MNVDEQRVQAACAVVRLRARAEKMRGVTEPVRLQLEADRMEKHYRRLRAIESAELLSTAREFGMEPIV